MENENYLSRRVNVQTCTGGHLIVLTLNFIKNTIFSDGYEIFCGRMVQELGAVVVSVE